MKILPTNQDVYITRRKGWCDSSPSYSNVNKCHFFLYRKEMLQCFARYPDFSHLDNHHPDNCRLAQLPSRTITTQDYCHPDNCHNWFRLVHKADMRVSLLTTVTTQESQSLCRKQAQRSHWVNYWLQIHICDFSINEKFKHGCVHPFSNSFPLDAVIRRLYETSVRISTTSVNHFCVHACW